MTTAGRLLVASTTTLGSTLAGDHDATDPLLAVASVIDFDESGGWVKVNDDLVEYTAIDHVANTLTLAIDLSTNALDGDRVDVWDPDQNRAATEVECIVAPEGDEGAADLASVEHHLEPLMPLGMGSDTQQNVTMERRDHEWVVTGILGKSPRINGEAVWNPHSFREMASKDIPDSTHTQVNQWTADVETDGIDFAGAAWTVVEPAWYSMTAWATWVSNPSGRRRVRILVNDQLVEVNVVGADTETKTSHSVSTNARLEQGDEVAVWVYQSSGGTLSLESAAFSMFRISI